MSSPAVIEAKTARLVTAPRWLPIAVGLAAVLAIYAPLIPPMASEWLEFPSLSHGFAIPLIAAYLLWSRRREIVSRPLGSSPLGLPLVVLALAMLVVGSLSGEPFVARVSLPVALLGATLFLAGPAVTRQAWIGIMYLLFMVPLPFVVLKSLTYRSQLFDAAVTAGALPWLGVPVFHQGILLHLPNMTLEVAPDCSSIPALAALASLGVAFAYLHARPPWVRAVLILAAVPLALGSNIVRIILTAFSAYHLGPIALDNIIHKSAGTTVFLATVGLLFVLDGLLLRLARAGSRRA